MKKLIVFTVLACLSAAIFAQESTTSYTYTNNDTTYVDTLNRNLIGLNVFPALGMLGGGVLPSTKIYIQYKHLYQNMNLRASLNYINYYKENNNIDIVRMTTDTLVGADNDTIIGDSLTMRKYYYDVYSYDFRIGIEAAFQKQDMRFFIGAGLIGGYHYTGENYYHYRKAFDGYPVDRINLSPIMTSMGYRRTDFLKIGMDFTIGVDINISPNCVITVQYAPELSYYKNIKQEILDPDNVYTTPITDNLLFTPDYIDFVVCIRF